MLAVVQQQLFVIQFDLTNLQGLQRRPVTLVYFDNSHVPAAFQSKTHVLLLHHCQSRLQLLATFFHSFEGDQQCAVRSEGVILRILDVVHHATPQWTRR